MGQKCRHIGMDADIQAMDGNLMVMYMPDLSVIQAYRLPSLDSGFRQSMPE